MAKKMYLSTFSLSDADPESLSVEEITELTPEGNAHARKLWE